MGHIHSRIYRALPCTANAIVQCHSPAIEAVSCLEEGLLFLSLQAAPLHGRVAYYDWEGPLIGGAGRLHEHGGDLEDLAAALRSVARPPAQVLLLRNLGAAAIGATVGEAFVAMQLLHRACSLQVRALAMQAPLLRPSEEHLERAALRHVEQHGRGFEAEWRAFRHWLGASEHGDLPEALRLAGPG